MSSAASLLSRQSHRLIQAGVAFFLFSALFGFVIPHVGSPRLGLSVHTLSALSGVILLALGLMWPRLQLGPPAARIAFWTFLYSAVATVAAYVMAAFWNAGQSIITLTATGRGSAAQETIISVVLYSAAPTVLIALVLILWGLRRPPAS